MSREPGFYWIFINGIWTVAEWSAWKSSLGWTLPSDERIYQDEEFESIDEKRIRRA